MTLRLTSPVSRILEEVAVLLVLLPASMSLLTSSSLLPGSLGLRLTLGAAAVLLLPGYLLVRIRPGLTSAIEALPVAFALSFIAVSGACVLTMEFGGSSRVTAALFVLVMWGLWLACLYRGAPTVMASDLAADVRRIVEPDRLLRLGVVVAAIGVGASLHILGARIQSPEEVVIARKLFENQVVHLDNVMHMRAVTPTYLYAPLAFAVALIARVSRLDVVLVLLKLQGFFGFVGILTFYALVKQVFGSERIAGAGGLVAAALVTNDPWAWCYSVGMIIPFPNRYGMAPGLLLPLTSLLALKALSGSGRGIFLVATPLLALSMAMVHAREGIQFLMWLLLAGVVLALTQHPKLRVLKSLAVLLGLTLALFYAYKLRQNALVLHLHAVTHSLQEGMDDYLRSNLANPWMLLVGRVPERLSSPVGDYVFDNYPSLFVNVAASTTRFHVATAIFLAPLLLAFRRVTWAVLLAASLLVTFVAVRVPLVYVISARLAGSPDVGALAGPFTLWATILLVAVLTAIVLLADGFLARALDIAARGGLSLWERSWLVAAAPLAAGGLSTLFVGLSAGLAELLLGNVDLPGRWLVLAVPCALVLGAVRPLPDPLHPPRRPWLCLVLVGAALLPFWRTMPRRGPSLPALLADRASHIVVSNLSQPYAELRRALPSDLPSDLMFFVREKVPPLSVFICPREKLGSLLNYTDQFVAHGTAGDVPLSTDTAYMTRYVRGGEHPVYNFLPYEEIRDITLRFLDEFKVEYAIVDPEHRDHLERIFSRFNAEAPVFTRVYRTGEYSLWRIERPALLSLTKAHGQP